MDQHLIVGLGNPGQRYRNTWHNMGYRTVEELGRRWGVSFKPGKGDFFFGENRTVDSSVTLMAPTSFMNRSGIPIADWLRYYRLSVENLLVIFDDHDLPLGRIRIRTGGSAGGHRGLEDIIMKLGTFDFPRLRIGIRTDDDIPDLSRQVLSKIPKKYTDDVEQVVQTAADAVEMALAEGYDKVMSYYNGLIIT